ncbi:MAG TPA: TonB-dependent receptor [Segetibacter sp.]
MNKFLFLAIFCFTFFRSYSQTDPTNEDSIIRGNLGEVVVKAFEQNRRLQDVPAAVNYIGTSQLARYNNITILPAVNSTPGGRMEERSPGSYRLNIRGSSLRSPFGVRNVKIYYNNIPLTDPGGHTYLNQLGFYNVQSIEIIKGPGSSLYGAGTGGVMLIESPSNRDEVKVNYSTGSYNLQNIHTSVAFGSANVSNTISYQHQTSDGYRNHTNMRRDMFAWNSSIKAGENSQLQTSFLYGDLFYQTPGALTFAEYNQNPRSARPTVGFFPGSVATRAAIYQKTFLAGATYKQEFNKQFQNTTSFYGAFTQLKNPTTRNYGRSSEPHFGGRTVFQFKKDIGVNNLVLHAGAEVQQGYTTLRIYSNKGGNPDTLQTDDELFNRQSFIFSQLSWQHKQWLITTGASLNQLNVEFTRLSNTPFTIQKRKYNNELAPRLAVLRKVGEDLSIYGSIGKGFSPPTSAELLPSGGTINTALNAEQGTNYEIGVKGSFLDERLSYDVNAFYFRLRNTIVQRRDATGGDFFINAGSTDQKGLETFINYRLISSDRQFSDFSKVWLSHTWNKFKYDEFKQLANDFSGKRLPSTAPHSVAAGFDFFSKAGFYLNLTYFYSDPIYLNDANTVKAGSYNLVGSRMGFKKLFYNKYTIDLFAGADNLLDVQYSLGNDINAFGERFYNAAPRRNYFAGVSFRAAGKP